jgi:hypothetical protein
MALWLAAGAGCGRLGYTPVADQGEAGAAADVVPRDLASPPRDLASSADGASDVPIQAPADAAHDLAPDLSGPPASDGPGPDAAPDAPGPDASPPDACVMCPASSVTLVQTTVTPVRGTEAGAQLIASCLMNGVLIGFEGTQARNQNYPWLQSAAGICGIATVTGSGGSATVSITESSKLSTLGSTNGSPWARRCPANQVLVGFEGNSAGWMGIIGFRCAPMLPGADGSFTVGPVTTLPIVGAPSGSPFPTTDCPAGHVAVGEHLRSSTGLDGFGLVCGKFVRK